MMETKPKSCSVCGSDKIECQENTPELPWIVICLNCGNKGEGSKTHSGAIQNWNNNRY